MSAGKPGLDSVVYIQPALFTGMHNLLAKFSTQKSTVHFKSIMLSFRMQFQSCSTHNAVTIKMAAATANMGSDLPKL